MIEPPPETKLERHFCWLNDARWNWIGLEWLRPRPHEYFTFNIMILIAVILYLPASAVGATGIYFWAYHLTGWDEIAAGAAMATFTLCFVGTFSYQYVGGHFWNRRAFRMRLQPEFAEPASDDSGHTNATQKDEATNPYVSPASSTSTLNLDESPPLELLPFCRGLNLILVCGSFFAFSLFLRWRGVQYAGETMSQVQTATLESLVAGTVIFMVTLGAFLAPLSRFRSLCNSGKVLCAVVLFAFCVQRFVNPRMLYDEFRYAWFAGCGLILVLTGLFELRADSGRTVR